MKETVPVTDGSKQATAVACFKQGFACSQAVLSTFAEDFGLDRQLALKVAAGLGGGMGRMAETCGAVTGAVLVLGLRFGGTRGDDQQAKETAYEKVREFVRQFRGQHQSIVCRELLRCDISTPDGLKDARDRKLFATQCAQYVEDAVAIVERLVR